jgi:hypothetical protein
MTRLFADCRLTASILPTGISAKPDGARLLPRHSVGNCRLNPPTRRLGINQYFQGLPSVGSRQFTSPSYGGVLTPPLCVGVSATRFSNQQRKENRHA